MYKRQICGPPRHVALRTTADKGKAGNSNAGKQVEKNSYDILRNKLLQTFPDVLSDELSPTPMKTDVPMHITLKKDYFPFKTLSARRVALRYEDEAAKTINELIEKKVITRVKETTEWCSPAFFVPKGDKIRVRLVTDYTELNKHVMRPVHLFSHTREILQAVPNHAKHLSLIHI